MRLPGLARRRRSDSRGQSLVEFALLAPIMIFLLFAILDLARIYTAMASVESAAREAADYATAQGAAKLSTSNWPMTVAEMKRRACLAASDLHDYVGVDADSDGVDEDCTNPSFAWCVATSTGGPCVDGAVFPQAIDPANPTTVDCDNADKDPPCTVKVTMSHNFHLFVPFQIDFFGVKLGLPASLAFQRDSTFAMTDIDVAEPRAEPWAMSGRDRRRRRWLGQALPEFAIVAPMFFVLLFGIIEAGRFVYYYETLSNAAREGARYAIVNGAGSDEVGCPTGPAAPLSNPCDVSGVDVETKVRKSSIGVLGSAVTVQRCWWISPGSCDFTTHGPGNNARGASVTVKASYTYRSLIPIVPLPNITVTAESSLVINN